MWSSTKKYKHTQGQTKAAMTAPRPIQPQEKQWQQDCEAKHNLGNAIGQDQSNKDTENVEKAEAATSIVLVRKSMLLPKKTADACLYWENTYPKPHLYINSRSTLILIQQNTFVSGELHLQ